MSQHKLVLIPVYNESNTIKKIAKEFIKEKFKVLIIDDGSIDNTYIKSKETGAKVYKFEKNIGVGHAIRYGLKLAFQEGFSNILTIDGDGQHSIEDAIDLYSYHIKNNLDLTIGNRFGSNLHSIPFTKKISNSLATVLINNILKTSLSDVACGMRAYSNRVFNFLNEISNNRFGFLYEIIIKIKEHGLKIDEYNIKANYSNQIEGSKKDELLDFINTLIKYSEKTLKIDLLNYRQSIQNKHDFIIDLNKAPLFVKKKIFAKAIFNGNYYKFKYFD